MTSVLFNFTNKCNLQCRHCYAKCGPKGETMGMEDIVKVLGHVPKGIEYFDISGGEPLAAKKRLMQMLGFIKEHKQEIMPDAKISMLTNGFWAKKENAYETLKSLFEHDVSFIQISNDKFHKEQGLDGDELYKTLNGLLDRLAKETGKKHLGPFIKDDGWTLLNINISFPKDTAQPFGRGKTLAEYEMSVSSVCFLKRKKEVVIAPDGLVYPCCWRVTPSIGSALESPLEELVDNMPKNELFAALLEDGPAEAAKLLGVYDKADKAIYEKNPCRKCEEIFRGMR